MKAVGFTKNGPITDADALVDVDVAMPVPGPRDVLIQVKATALNPVDTKVRRGVAPPPGETRVIGWDCAGVVTAVGNAVTVFHVGDEVWCAGTLNRPGTNAEYVAVDERIVGKKPTSLSFVQAAALPLTAVTAWEMLFDRMALPRRTDKKEGAILVVGGAGGVGSILIQLARKLTGMTVIATASRDVTRAWCTDMGAHHVIDHKAALLPQLQALGFDGVDVVAALTGTEQHLASYPDVLRPQGKLCVIDDPKTLDVMPFKRKSISVHWELMFTRSIFETADMIRQHEILNEVADLVDAGVLRTTLARNFGRINASNLRQAHTVIESGTAHGKIVLEGF